MENENKESSMGAIIAAVIILIVLAAGGLYIYRTKGIGQSSVGSETTPGGEQAAVQNQAAANGDTLEEIQADFGAIESVNVDAEVGSIDKELQ